MSRFLVLKDTREKKGVWHFPEDDHCLGTISEKVDHGDYSIKGLEGYIFLERKANLAELAHNITEDRFTRLLENAREYKYRFIIIESYYDDLFNFPHNEDVPRFIKKKIRITPGFLMAFISRCYVTYQIPVIFAGSHSNAQKIAYRLLKDIFEKEKDNMVNMP